MNENFDSHGAKNGRAPHSTLTHINERTKTLFLTSLSCALLVLVIASLKAVSSIQNTYNSDCRNFEEMNSPTKVDTSLELQRQRYYTLLHIYGSNAHDLMYYIRIVLGLNRIVFVCQWSEGGRFSRCG